jgi:xanthine/CO dehydrogenase XdhC/CoxF family maturation factor
MTARRLSDKFREWKKTGKPLVLASVYETDGSTYSKAGAQMLITQDGNFQGMLSGGCLEGDLAERAKKVAGSGEPQLVTYDLRAEDDDLWGLGVGCEGMIRVFLQRLDTGNDYEPFSSMCLAFEGTELQIAVTVVESEIPNLQPGTSLVLNEGSIAWSDIGEPQQQQLAGTIKSGLSEKHSSMKSLDIEGESCSLLLGVLRPYPRVLVLGAGMDAEPLVRMISELGWRVTVSDHRPAYIENGDFSRADTVFCIPADNIAAEFELDQFDAAIIMSHHLVTDATYLATLAGTRIPYVGLLGPPHRRERLLHDLRDVGDALEGRLYGPAGLDINASGPASIALSIVAQMHRIITTY